MSGEADQAWHVTIKRLSGTSGDARGVTSARGTLLSHSALSYLAVAVAVCGTPALVAFGLSQPATAQTFEEASSAVLVQIEQNFTEECEQDLTLEPCWVTLGSNLALLLEGNQPAGVVSAAPATVSPQAAAGLAIERRLQAVRESEERRREAGLTTAIPASYPRDHILAANGQVQIPPAGGATPEIVVGPAQCFSLFISAGATALNHHNNRFEDGYEAQLPTVTVGADYWINPRLLAGVGFNYTNFDGTYDDGGGFDKDISPRYCMRPCCRSSAPSSMSF